MFAKHWQARLTSTLKAWNPLITGCQIVNQAQVAEMVRILELFARYISNSWKRLQLISEFQRNHDRELSLDRKELASILLSGEVGDFRELKALASRAGLQGLPERVMVLQIEHLHADSLPKAASPALTLNRLSHMVEYFCQSLANSLAMVVRPGEICIFTSHEVRNRSHQRLSLEEMAESILAKVRSQTNATARIGISEEHHQPAELLKAYQEACAALDTGGTLVSFFSDPESQSSQPCRSYGAIAQSISTRQRCIKRHAGISRPGDAVGSLAHRDSGVPSLANVGDRTPGAGDSKQRHGSESD